MIDEKTIILDFVSNLNPFHHGMKNSRSEMYFIASIISLWGHSWIF